MTFVIFCENDSSSVIRYYERKTAKDILNRRSQRSQRVTLFKTLKAIRCMWAATLM